jgi:nucleotidyltransferase-like protein
VGEDGAVLGDARLREVADELVAVPGVVAVLLGGSRARGTARPDSDVDLGLYYRPPLDVDALRLLARTLAGGRGGGEPELTGPGAWGAWVDGGGWLELDGTPVDWLYRDVDRVHRSWQLARTGTFDFHVQVGHPLGVPDFSYAGEVALGVVLADPTGELTALHEETARYPAPLARAVVDRLWEAEFLLATLAKPAARGDTALLAGSLFRVVGLCAHAVHARAGRWVVNEKGLVEEAGRLPGAPVDFSRRAHRLLGRLGTTPDALQRAVEDARALLADVAASG